MLFRKKKPKIVVVRQVGGIGDVLSMSCVYRGLKEKYPKHHLTLVTCHIYLSGALTDIANHNPFIDEIFVIEPYDATTKKTTEVWHQDYGKAPHIEDQAWYEKAEMVFDLNTACVDYEWPALKTPEGITKPRYQVWSEACGVVPSTYKPVWEFKRGEIEEGRRILEEATGPTTKPIVGLGIRAADPKRAISTDHIQAIAHKLRERGAEVVTVDQMIGIPGYAQIIGKRVPQVISAIKHMDAFVTADSGLLHAAGVAETPIIGLFGPTDPEMRMGMYKGSAIDSRQTVSCAPCWYNYPCLKEHPRRHYECMQKIDPDVIVEETMRWIANPTRTSLPMLK